MSFNLKCDGLVGYNFGGKNGRLKVTKRLKVYIKFKNSFS